MILWTLLGLIAVLAYLGIGLWFALVEWSLEPPDLRPYVAWWSITFGWGYHMVVALALRRRRG